MKRILTSCLLVAATLFVSVLTLRAQEFPIAVGSDTTFSGGAVYGGLNGIVAVQGDSTSPYTINAQLLGGPAQLIGSRISFGATGIPPGGVPVFDGTNYFLVWLEFSGTVKGQFLSTSGSLVGTAITIATGVSFEHFPYGVIFADSTYLVLFVKNDGYLYGQRMNKAGSLLGNQIQISSNLARDFSYAFDGTNILIAWVEMIQDTDKDVYGQFVSPSGALVGTNFVIDNGPNYSDNPTSLAFDGTRYLLGFHEMPPSATKWTLVGRFITTTGTIQESFTICDSTQAPDFASVATDGNNYLITWVQGSNRSLMGRFFDKSGSPLGASFIAMGPDGGKIPFGGVGFGGGLYLVVAAKVDSNMSDGDVYGRFYQPLTSVGEHRSPAPEQWSLMQNYPNPFNPSTEISFRVPVASRVTLSVYNILGQKMAEVFNGEVAAGIHTKVWHAGVASGVYFCRLEAVSLSNPRQRFVETHKMVLVR